MPGKIVLSFDNVDDLEKSNIPNDVYAIVLLGFYIIGDAPAVTYTRWTNGTDPETPPDDVLGSTIKVRNGRLKSLDGKWWEISPPSDYLDVRWFGAKMTVSAPVAPSVIGLPIDDLKALQAAIDCALGNVGSPPPPPIRAEKVRTAFIPEGTLYVSNTVFLRGVTLRGTGPMQSSIVLTTANAICIHMDGGAGLSPPRSVTGGGLQSITISILTGLQGFIGVKVAGDAIRQPDECVFEDVKIAGGGTWTFPMLLDGLARRLPQGVIGLRGLRKVTIRNVFFGDAMSYSLIADGVSDLTIYNAGSFGKPAGAGDFNLGFLIRGGAGSPEIPAIGNTPKVDAIPELISNLVQLVACNVPDRIFIYRTQSVVISGVIKEVYCSTEARGCVMYGTLLKGSGGDFITAPNMGNTSYVTIL
jgi:hypothetical protein